MQAQIHHVMSSNPTPYTSDLQRPSTNPPVNCKAEAGTPINAWSMRSITMENAVVVLCRKGCCMSHVVTQLLSTLGVNPHVVEIDPTDAQLAADDCNSPAIFIGGRLLGGVDRLLAAHITGSLVPQLKAAGALWL